MSTAGDVPSPEVDRVLDALAGEIGRIGDEKQAPGWNNFAVVAAIGALLWAMSDGLDVVRFDRPLVHLLLALSFSIDALLTLRQAMSPGLVTRLPRYQMSRSFSSHRLLAVMFIARSAVMIWGARWVVGTWWSWKVMVTVISLGPITVLCFAMLAMSVLDYPMAPTRPTRLSVALHTLLLAGLSLGAVGFGLSAWAAWVSGGLASAEIQFAGGVTAIVYLVSLIVNDTPNTALNTLCHVRRDLAFGRISVAAAIEQSEIAILGLKLSDVMQKHIAEQIRLNEVAQAEIASAKSVVAKLQERVPATGPYTQEQEALVQTARVGMRTHLVKAREAGVRAHRHLLMLRVRFKNDPANEAPVIWQRLGAAADGVVKAVEDFREHYDRVPGLLDADAAAHPRATTDQ